MVYNFKFNQLEAVPEGPELRIMSDFINNRCVDKEFNNIFHIEKGNIPKKWDLNINKISASSRGKNLRVNIYHDLASFYISVFMGMSGNWKFVPTSEWSNTKFVRLRLDTTDGWSLLLYGSYMGPKYRLGDFTGVKRGPDIVFEFSEFEKGVIENLNNKIFDKPICEVLLDQRYFSGIGNYIRSTLLYYLDINPFDSARNIINNYPQILELCRETLEKAYNLGGGQLSDWSNPFGVAVDEFDNWIFYQKGNSVKDNNDRTFWYNPKWENKMYI